MANEGLKQKMSAAKVFQWQIAERLGISEGGLCRKMRHELVDDEQEKILHIIGEIAAEREGA